MDVDNRAAFARGFLQRCAEERLTKEAVLARIELAGHLKQASDPGLLSSLTGTALGLPVLSGILGGGALGYGLAKFTEPEADLAEVRAKEIANTYRLYAQRAAARRKIKGYRPATGI